MPTVHNLSEVRRKCGQKRDEPNLMSGVNDEQEQEPHGGRGEGPWGEERVDGITPLGRCYQGGGEGGVEKLTMISLVLRFQLPEV